MNDIPNNFGEGPKGPGTDDWGVPPPGAGLKEHAAYLKRLGYEPVPVNEGEKHPGWYLKKEFHNGLPDHVRNSIRWQNFPALGTLTGNACNFGDGTGLVLVDIDNDIDAAGKIVKSAASKLRELEIEFYDGQSFETLITRTCSDGLHVHFKVERDKMPGCKSPWKAGDIYVKGQGGFVMMPPSPAVPPREGDPKINVHSSYEFVSSTNGDNIMRMPPALLARITAANAGGGAADGAGTKARVATPSSTANTNAFGGLIDGREEKMTSVSCRVAVAAFEKNPIRPPLEALQIEAWQTYLQSRPKTRIQGVDNLVGLEMEDRGRSAMDAKVKRLWDNWETKVRELAAQPKLASKASSKPGHDQAGGSTNDGDGGATGGGDGGPFSDPTEPEFKIDTAAEFLAKWQPPEYVFEGVMLRRRAYSWTGMTGHGKTAVALLMAVYKSKGWSLGGHAAEPGRVLYLCGENPDDVRDRFKVVCEVLQVDPNDLDVDFVDGRINIADRFPAIVRHYQSKAKELALVIVDTLVAFFHGEEETNMLMLEYIHKHLRILKGLPGGPCVLIPAHPNRAARKHEDCIPRGGGSTTNELDGNFTMFSKDPGPFYETTEMSVTGKHRGAPFDPIVFKLELVYSKLLTDAKGKIIPTIVAKVLSGEESAQLARTNRSDDEALYRDICEHQESTQRDRAERLGWLYAPDSLGMRKPATSKVARVVARLKNDNRIDIVGNRLVPVELIREEAKRHHKGTRKDFG